MGHDCDTQTLGIQGIDFVAYGCRILLEPTAMESDTPTDDIGRLYPGDDFLPAPGPMKGTVNE